MPTHAARKDGSDITNKPLRNFLLKLAVEDKFRQKYTDLGDDDARKAFLMKTFRMGKDTAEAVVRGTRGDVKARFGASDQTGFKVQRPRQQKATRKR